MADGGTAAQPLQVRPVETTAGTVWPHQLNTLPLDLPEAPRAYVELDVQVRLLDGVLRDRARRRFAEAKRTDFNPRDFDMDTGHLKALRDRLKRERAALRKALHAAGKL